MSMIETIVDVVGLLIIISIVVEAVKYYKKTKKK